MEKKEYKNNKIVHFFSFLILILGLIIIYAKYIGVEGIKVKDYSIVSDKIPKSFDGFSIVQFSDLELGSTFNIDDLDELVKKVNSLNPSIIVFTGDIISKYYSPSESDINKIISSFSKMDPLIGKYSIRGDDDTGDILYNRIMGFSGFMDLTNKYELIYYKGLTPICLYGLDSSISGKPDYDATFSYPKGDEKIENLATYRILLSHEPDILDKVKEYNISLMLSGHSHNSEINIPYIKTLYNLEGATKYYDPEYKIGNTRLFISSGLGTSKLKMRIFSKPSISVFKLFSK